MTTTKTHYLGTPYASRAACGRYVGPDQETAPATTDQPEQVTCLSCGRAMAS